MNSARPTTRSRLRELAETVRANVETARSVPSQVRKVAAAILAYDAPQPPATHVPHVMTGTAVAVDPGLNYPGGGGGMFVPPTPPTLQGDGTFRSSASGDIYSGGIISGHETNPALLTAQQWAAQSELMQRSDGAVGLAVQGYLQTMRSPDWEWVAAELPATATADERKWADFYARFHADMWDRMSVSWDQQLSYLSRFGLDGFRYAEEISVVRRAIADPDGKRHLRTFVDVFADCEPGAHFQWTSPDGGRTLDGVVQFDVSSGLGSTSIDREGNLVTRDTMPRTDASRLLLLVHGMTGTNWNGDGGKLRPAWSAWKDKQNALNLLAVALDRFGVPTPHRKTDETAMREANYTDPQIKQANTIADAACRQWAGGESTFIGSDSNIEIDFIGGVLDASNFLDAITSSDEQIFMAMGQPFLAMGLGDSTGSRALSTQSASHFDVGVENDLDYIRDQINGRARAGGGIVGRSMASNFPDVPEWMWPRIEHGGLRTDDYNDLAGVMSALKSTGMLRHPVVTRDLFDRVGIKYSEADIQRIATDSGDPLENVSIIGAREQDNPPEPAGRPGTGRPPGEGGAENETQDKKPRVVTP